MTATAAVINATKDQKDTDWLVSSRAGALPATQTHQLAGGHEEGVKTPLTGRRWWAIELPDGRLWREPIRSITEPYGTAPDLWPSKERAEDALANLTRAVIDTYGPLDYRPRLVQWSADRQGVR